jgi:hypothetical protein
MNQCKVVRDLLALRPAEWGADEQRQVRAHLGTCPDCAALSRAYAQQDRLIQAAPRARLTPAQRGQFLSRIHRERRRHAMNIKLSTALSTALALVALVALTLGLYTLFRGRDKATVGVPTAPRPTHADEALWKWVDDATEDPELAHQTTNVLQRQPWWNGEVILFTYQDRLPDADGGARQKVLAWVLAEPGPLGQDWAVTMSGSTREAIQWLGGLPDFFWLSQQQDEQGRTMSVIYGLWFARVERPETLQLTWNGAPVDIPLYNDSFLFVAEGNWEQRPAITWDCDSPQGGPCGVVLRTDEALPTPEPLIFGGEIRYDGQTLDPLTGKLIPFTLGQPNEADRSAPGQLYVPADVHFMLNWQVVAPPSADWVVFAHLMNEAGELLLSSDVGADWPAQPCPAGEYSLECNATTEHQWIFPADFPAGLYTIVVGMYDPASSMRAPVTSPTEETAPQVVLGQVQVLAEPASAHTQVTLRIFSGRPDPTWTLTPAQDAELRQRLGALRPTAQAFDEMGRLGYAGFSLLLPPAQGQPEQYVQVWDGVVQLRTQSQATLLADEDRALERWLLDSAVGRVEDEIIAAVRLELETPGSLPPAQEQHGFALYLLDQELSQDAPCGLEPILSSDDILTYTWETHEMTLTDEAYERLAELEVPVAPGISFVVCVDGAPIYRGAFWTPASSAIFDGIAIVVPPVQNTRSIRLQLGYPSPEFFTGEDLRTDPRILEALEKAGKLF